MTDYYANVFGRRIADRNAGWMDIRSNLLHFALINYAVPISRLIPHIPQERFEIVSFEICGRESGLVSAVPFLDDDFCFSRLAPFARFRFGQTNHRVYVIDRTTGEHVVWFFGTTLGSWVVRCARALWRIPWHAAKYRMDCVFDSSENRYQRYAFHVESDWCAGEIELEDTGEPMSLLDGFETFAQQRLVLTHPVEGFFYRLDGDIGTYSVWHDEIPLSMARAQRLYFSLYERLGLLSREEMMDPHSILVCPKTLFEVHMPPRRLKHTAL